MISVRFKLCVAEMNRNIKHLITGENREGSKGHCLCRRLMLSIPSNIIMITIFIFLLVQVLPHVRSTKVNSYRGDLGGGALAPLDSLSDGCSLPKHIPGEVFQDGTLEEHLQVSYNILECSRDTHARKSMNNGPSYNDTWGFVIHDLENKGYNKDVGNRGDILHHLTNSKSSTNVGTNLTDSAANATIVPNNNNTLNNSKTRDGHFFVGDGEMLLEFIPSTVQNMKRESSRTGRGPVLSITDAMKHLSLTERIRAPVSSSGSTARQKPDDTYGDKFKNSRYPPSNDKYSSEGTGKRSSFYDNVSYGDFETARQDTDEEDLKRKKRGSSNNSSRSVLKADPMLGLPTSNLSNSTNSSSRYINAHDSSHAAHGRPNKSTANSSSRKSPLANLSSKLLPQKEILDGKISNAIGNKSENKGADTAWSCVYCTFSNERDGTVCEMCSRSRQTADAPAIKPLVAGGRQCDQCTLINDKEASTCSACGLTLDTCPTYI